MKKYYLYIICIFTFSTSPAFSESITCPDNWDNTAWVGKYSSFTYLKFKSDLIKNLKYTDRHFLMFMDDSVSLNDSKIVGHFTKKSLIQSEENNEKVDFEIGKIEDQSVQPNGTCYKFEINPQLRIKEVVTKKRDDCWIFGPIMCFLTDTRTTRADLKIKIENKNKIYGIESVAPVRYKHNEELK